MLGRKTGAGFYEYEGKMQAPNESLAQWRRAPVVAGGGDPGSNKATATTQPASSPPATAEELTHRLIFLMVNEAARCVEESVVDAPEDADYGMILGTGFAPFRGGPLRFAEHFGLKKVVDDLERLAQSEGKFLPCEILKKHAHEGTRFYAD
jgi:3-hydroxyacyl-CoA dehydrogenase